MIIEIPGFGYVTPIGVGSKIGHGAPIWVSSQQSRLKSKNETIFWVFRLMKSYGLYFYVYDNNRAYQDGAYFRGSPYFDSAKIMEFLDFIERN